MVVKSDGIPMVSRYEKNLGLENERVWGIMEIGKELEEYMWRMRGDASRFVSQL
jgi:hypothetical protein